MIGVNKFYIMKFQVKEIKKFNLMEQIEIEMKNGLHIQQYMDGMFNQFGHNILQVQILMQ